MALALVPTPSQRLPVKPVNQSRWYGSAAAETRLALAGQETLRQRWPFCRRSNEPVFAGIELES